MFDYLADEGGSVFDHGTARGMYLHFKMQETEIDDHRAGGDGEEDWLAVIRKE